MTKTVRIGTRESKLAVAQATLVAEAIQKSRPGIEIRLVKIKTTGDRILDRALDRIGGKGLFVKELDEALRRGDVDLCVHSCKDVPAEPAPGLPIVAVSPRENARDVLILPEGAAGIDPEKPIGCSGLRRQMQLGLLYPGKQVAPVRGNILTRLEKLDAGEYSALVLAAAGMLRLKLWPRVSRVFEIHEMLPAAGQGALAVQGRSGGDYDYLKEYNDPDAWDAVMAERAFIRRLGLGCGAPAAVYAEVVGDSLWLRAMLHAGRDEITGSRADAEKLGIILAEKLLAGV